jgi:hypothetical protein
MHDDERRAGAPEHGTSAPQGPRGGGTSATGGERTTAGARRSRPRFVGMFGGGAWISMWCCPCLRTPPRTPRKCYGPDR